MPFPASKARLMLLLMFFSPYTFQLVSKPVQKNGSDDDDALHDKLEICRDAEKVHSVIDDADQQGTDEGAPDGRRGRRSGWFRR
jgi:hypothetical protein